jgi:hypothetical protein
LFKTPVSIKGEPANAGSTQMFAFCQMDVLKIVGVQIADGETEEGTLPKFVDVPLEGDKFRLGSKKYSR